MTALTLLALFCLAGVLTLSSYVRGIFSERGKLLSREFQENIDAWEALAEPRFGMGRDRISLSAEVCSELSLGGIAIVLAALSLRGPVHLAQIVQVLLGLVLTVALFSRFLPYVFFTRTRGEWVRAWVVPLRLLFYLVSPVTVLLSFLLSVAALAEPSPAPDAVASDSVEALIEAGREEGILEEHDSELVRSAVEFGDKVVREVMTPRPEMFAVPAAMTIEDFTEALKVQGYSRVPVYRGTLDQITGIAFAHDVLQIFDTEASTQLVGSIERPAAFIPETKRVNELLREMQREKQHMQIVIDEYGSVAGLVTIEDLLEEIVGDISDEHDAHESFTADADGAFVVPGSLEVGALEELWGTDAELMLPPDAAATTLGGLVTETAGRIPLVGEVLTIGGIRAEVLASTGRRVESLRVSLETSHDVTGAA